MKDADPAIIEALGASGRLVLVEDYTHAYPHCWRCGTPLVYWGKPTWFAATSTRHDDLLRENETIGWHPEHIKHGRFGDWLANNVDWALSRDRFWGTPLPFWRCGGCGNDTCVGSVAELLDAGRARPDGPRPPPPRRRRRRHRVPRVRRRAHRVEPVLDAWFDSGAMPAAQLHYPFENEDAVRAPVPGRLHLRGDRPDPRAGSTRCSPSTRSSSTARRTATSSASRCSSTVTARRCRSRGATSSTRGRSSSSRGARRAPVVLLLGRVAVDEPPCLRGEHRRVDPPVPAHAVEHVLVLRHVRDARWLGARATPCRARSTHVLDRWVRSRLHATIARGHRRARRVRRARGPRRRSRASSTTSRNWYVRRSRPRFWKAADPHAHATLHECLVAVAMMLAPLCPFVSDDIYRNLTAPASPCI